MELLDPAKKHVRRASMNEVRSNVVSGEAKVLAFQNRGCIITIYFIYTLIYIYTILIYIYILYIIVPIHKVFLPVFVRLTVEQNTEPGVFLDRQGRRVFHSIFFPSSRWFLVSLVNVMLMKQTITI